MHGNKPSIKWAAVGLILLILLGSAFLGIYAGMPLIRFISDSAAFRAWVDNHGIYSRIAFMGMMIFQVLIALIPGEPFEIAAGYAFGAVEGTFLCLAACTVGSVLVFWLVRIFGNKLIRIFFSEEQIASVLFLKSSPKRDFLFLFVFILPGTPKDLLSYYAGATDIRFPAWLLICSLGRIPSVVSSSIGGNALGDQSYLYAVIVFAVTLVISVIGLLIYNHVCSRHKRGEGSH